MTTDVTNVNTMSSVITVSNALDRVATDKGIKRLHALHDSMWIVRIEGTTFPNSKKMEAERVDFATQHNADVKMLRLSGKVLTDSVMKRLTAIKTKAYGLIRTSTGKDSNGAPFYKPTPHVLGPWGRGEVLVLNESYPALYAEFNACIDEMKEVLHELEGKWDALKQEAQAASGDLWDENLYPQFHNFCETWSLKMFRYRLPEFDPRFALRTAEREDIEDQTLDLLTEKLTGAFRDAAEQLLTSFRYVTASLGGDTDTRRQMTGHGDTEVKSDRTTPLYQSMFDNLSKQLATVESLATTLDDGSLKQLCADARGTLGGMTADHLRKNPSDRMKMAQHAESLTRRAEKVITHSQAEVDSVVNSLAAFA